MLVRSLLEFCVQFWSPCYRKDIIKLERVLKKYTRMLPGMEILNYKEGLNRLGLLTLEHRRLIGDIIQVYKIMRGLDKVNGRCLFPRVGDFKTKWHILN
eukprot:g46295.t1